MQRPRNVTSWDEVPVVIDLPYAARILGNKSVRYMQELCKAGKRPAFKHGRFWLMTKENLRNYVEQVAPIGNTSRPA